MQRRDIVERLFQSNSGVALTLVEGSERRLLWSWHRLQQQRRYCEAVLRAAGVLPGDRILVMTVNSPQFFALLLASLSLRLCFMPVHPDFSNAGLRRLLSAQSPALVVIDDMRQRQRFGHHCVLRLHERDRQWLKPLRRRWRQQPRQRLSAKRLPNDAVLLFHSSGSTGTPKGICYTRTMLDTFLRHLALLYAAFPDDETDMKPTARVNVLPVTHWGGLSFCLQTLLEDRTLHLWRGGNPHDHLTLLRATGCRLLMLVPALLQDLLQATATTLPGVRHCLAMGEAISTAQLQQLSQQLGVRVHNAYGMSECLTGIFNTAGDVAAPYGSCGRQRFGEVKLIDADGVIGGSGELCVRNATTRPCYTDQTLNRERYRQGWYHTGDRFIRDADGYYFFTGRTDSMCVINGRNVYPHEVEEVLGSNAGIRQCIAAPITTADGKRRLALAVVLQSGFSIDANELLDFYLVAGAGFAAPVWLEFWPELPLLAGGKPDRQRCTRDLQQAYDRVWPQHDAMAAI